MRPRTRWLAGGVALIAALTAAPTAAVAAPRPILLHGAGAPNAAGTGGAYTYDPALVPAGTKVAVLSISGRDTTRTLLAVSGLLPNRTYGAHLHVNPCGQAPTAAGGHYQQVPDPVQPSVDADYANPRNEVWLDVTTNAAGAGVATARNPWRYRANPGSLVLHAEPTNTHDGHAGTAGARVACVTLRGR